jgi:Uma2 family endonuclease
MSGASREHNLVVFNMNRTLGNQLIERPCEAYSSDMLVRVPSGNHYYPDISVICGDPIIDNKKIDTLLNPTLIIEVLSSSKEKFDRGEKFFDYRTLESLQEYVLASQYKPHIERFTRQPDGNWLFSEVTSLNSTMQLASIDCLLALADVYAKVSFDAV